MSQEPTSDSEGNNTWFIIKGLAALWAIAAGSGCSLLGFFVLSFGQRTNTRGEYDMC